MSIVAGYFHSIALQNVLRIGPTDAIDFFDGFGFSPLLNGVACANNEAKVRNLLKCGANPNSAGMHTYISPRSESPTSLAMYSSEAFKLWLSSLSEARIDINTVIDKEVEKGPLYEAGWTRETLQMLFEWEFAATDFFQDHDRLCSACHC